MTDAASWHGSTGHGGAPITVRRLLPGPRLVQHPRTPLESVIAAVVARYGAHLSTTALLERTRTFDTTS